MTQPRPLIAVVDDEESICKALARVLKSAGLDVETFSSGASFLASIQTHQPDCVLLDLDMPIMNGLELVRNVRSNEKYAKVTICMVTTETDIVQLDTVIEAGANAYVMKPFTKELIQEKVRSLGF